jgi:predicted acetyltransferase
MSEFYVKKDYRKLGVGKEAARLAFKLFPGKWEVREMHSNKPAVAFWNRTISEITSDKFDQVIMENDLWNGPIQTFDILA